MAEVGIDISAETPKILTDDAVKESDVCITMGCGDTRPVFSGKCYLDWKPGGPGGPGRCGRHRRHAVREVTD